ncbi:MEDS domain-containing protein [Bradyrhizobium commune]|nr:MEDS domain-containing protein [Bradyrhizobium commune]
MATARPSGPTPSCLRRTGINVIGDRPWGTHFSLFYETLQDLLDVHVRYLRMGLADNELCTWALSDPITSTTAVTHLRASIPGFDEHVRDGRLELIPGYEWYLKGDTFSPQRIIESWHHKLDQALARGLAGLRVSGNAFWCESAMWNAFNDYECALHRTLHGRKMMVLCTYSLQASRAADILDVTRTHHLSVSMRNGRWEILTEIGSPEGNETRELCSGNTTLSRSRAESLTDRERIILVQLLKGFSSKEAGRALAISPRTVDFHRANIMRKLGARNIAELASILLRER